MSPMEIKYKKMHGRVHIVNKPHHSIAHSIHKPLIKWGLLVGGDVIKRFIGGGEIMSHKIR